eukprot:1328503-Prymnesium_polylepis.2
MARRLTQANAKEGDLTVSLMWNTYDDLDLHVITPSGEEIFYSNKIADGGELDVDRNAGEPYTNAPVENVFFRVAPHGTYRVCVRNFGYHTSPPHGTIDWKAS